MKKLKLSELNLGNAEVLSREELKKVLGGMGSGGGSGDGRVWQCCWKDYPEDCSSCGDPGSCHPAAFLKDCSL